MTEAGSESLVKTSVASLIKGDRRLSYLWRLSSSAAVRAPWVSVMRGTRAGGCFSKVTLCRAMVSI